MARRRFFVDEFSRGEARLSGDDAEHLARVLRAEPGQRYELSDSRQVYLGEVTAANRTLVVFRLLEPIESPPAPVLLVLLASLVKFDRMEWMIEKATELGVDTIVPVEAQRTEKGLAAAAAKRLDRWRRIARESGQQCRRLAPPSIREPAPLRHALAESADYRFHLEEASAPLLLTLLPPEPRRADRVVALTGPEGGWTDPERAAIAAAGYQAASLGPLILRAETATAAALAVLGQYWQAGAINRKL